MNNYGVLMMRHYGWVTALASRSIAERWSIYDNELTVSSGATGCHAATEADVDYVLGQVAEVVDRLRVVSLG